MPRLGRRTFATSRWAALVAAAILVGLWLMGSIPGVRIPSSQKQGGTWQAVKSKDSRIEPNYTADEAKQAAIVDAFKHAWHAYERDAYGSDEYHPIGRTGTNLSASGGIGYAIIDALDTMQLMNLTPEYNRARKWIATRLSFDRDGRHNTFETTIRVLGGLLSAYHLSDEDPVFLERAVELADRMLGAFDTKSGLALPMVNLKKRQGVGESYQRELVSTAETTTLQLEFRYLSFISENEEYWRKVERVMKVVKDAKMEINLAPIYMNADTGTFMQSEIRLGSRGDSFYEYLLKQYLQTNRTEPVYQEMYQEYMDAIRTTLIRQGVNKGNVYTIELIPKRLKDGSGNSKWTLSPKQDHLVCFLGGSLMLGAVRSRAFVDVVSVPPRAEELTEAGRSEWSLGYEILETCIDTYDSPTGLSPEIAHFYVDNDGRDWKENGGKDWYVKGMENRGASPSYDARYILRPETIESLFIAFRLTGDVRYREIGWKIFQSIERWCKVPGGGYTSILDVMDASGQGKREDKMETFFLSETLKYLYLLFSDASVLPLDQYVFNTEAHPLPIFYPSIRTGFS